MDAAGTLQKRVPLGPASFFGARAGEPPAGFVFDLASEPNLTDEDRQAVLEGRAAVEVAMPLVAGVSAASTVPVIGARLIATPPA
jgi:hypothetical protein